MKAILHWSIVFIVTMGAIVHIAFNDIQDWHERQRARALWLTWCEMMAREQEV